MHRSAKIASEGQEKEGSTHVQRVDNVAALDLALGWNLVRIERRLAGQKLVEGIARNGRRRS